MYNCITPFKTFPAKSIKIWTSQTRPMASCDIRSRVETSILPEFFALRLRNNIIIIFWGCVTVALWLHLWQWSTIWDEEEQWSTVKTREDQWSIVSLDSPTPLSGHIKNTISVAHILFLRLQHDSKVFLHFMLKELWNLDSMWVVH